VLRGEVRETCFDFVFVARRNNRQVETKRLRRRLRRKVCSLVPSRSVVFLLPWPWRRCQQPKLGTGNCSAHPGCAMRSPRLFNKSAAPSLIKAGVNDGIVGKRSAIVSHAARNQKSDGSTVSP
jgi:hypothetical protein